MKTPNRLAALLFFAACALYQRAEAADLAIVGGTLVHPERPGVPVEPGMTVIVSNQRIKDLGPSKSVRIPKGAQVINAEGKWILPGLIDSHVHFRQSGNPFTRPDVIDATKVVPYAQELARNQARLPVTFKVWLASGVTSVADMGGPLWNFEVRDSAKRTLAAPRVAVAGPLISTAALRELELDDPPVIKVSSPEEARELARKDLTHKPDFVKFLLVHRPGDDLAAQEVMVKASGEVAHSAGVRFAVHAPQLEVAKSALRAGADILVHSVMDKMVDSEFLDLAKKRKAIYVPTLFVFDSYSLVITNAWEPTEPEQRLADPEILAHMKDLQKAPKEQLSERLIQRMGQPMKSNMHIAKDNLRRVWDAGIPIAMGTDAGNIGVLHGPSVFREMQLMRDGGLTMSEILISATVNGAKTMGMERDLGSIERGKLADIVILDANPLESVANLSKVYRTIKAGVAFEPAKLLRSVR